MDTCWEDEKGGKGQPKITENWGGGRGLNIFEERRKTTIRRDWSTRGSCASVFVQPRSIEEERRPHNTLL